MVPFDQRPQRVVEALRLIQVHSVPRVQFDDLGPGLTVLHGPNEAGKSTLLDFLRGVLFGFPDGRSRRPQRPPPDSRPTVPPHPGSGGDHPSRMFLAACQGKRDETA